MKKFKIVYGFGEADFIPISGDELHKAIFLFMGKVGRGTFENGAIRGSDISRIVPDWHGVMGWNRGYKLQGADFEQINPYEADYAQAYSFATRIAEIAMKDHRDDLIALPATKAMAVLVQEGNSALGLNPGKSDLVPNRLGK